MNMDFSSFNPKSIGSREKHFSFVSSLKRDFPTLKTKCLQKVQILGILFYLISAILSFSIANRIDLLIAWFVTPSIMAICSNVNF